ncbi:PEP-CTERM sorting domain-containing protein [Nostoc sp. CHAB 5784]|uniref:PEP-CTERM sorting domain-containing protein n=1 Tax=Nostoc mirabile TaxID=2907820 RepID=UPI001E378848|nr:PEP-CTERM sorting domain-containing protein [Nostoc mirabile]MCC5663962.1 PEP-CTERM sorting domain-containing protein [Nostoc mirabile CHAB5784]
MKKLSSTLKHHLCKGLSVIGFMYCAGGVGSPATAALATFDSFTEGFDTPVLTDGGITFSDLDQRISGSTPTFIIERADESLRSPFSPPNVLGFGGYAPGPGASFGRFGSLAISTGELASVASLDIFNLQFPATENILTLEAYLDGTLVGSNSVNFKTDDTGILYRQLSISDVTFDKLRLVASGSEDEGVLFIDIDNVRIDQTAIVPEPSSLLGLLMLGVSGVVFMLKRQPKSLSSINIASIK